MVVFAALALVTACTGQQRPAAKPARQHVPAQPAADAAARVAVADRAGTYQVGQRQLTFVKPSRIGRTASA